VTSYLRVGSRARGVLLGVSRRLRRRGRRDHVQAWRHVPSHFDMQTRSTHRLDDARRRWAVWCGARDVRGVRIPRQSGAAGKHGPRVAYRLVTLLIGLALGRGDARPRCDAGNTATSSWRPAGRFSSAVTRSACTSAGLPGSGVAARPYGWSEARRTRTVALAAIGYGAAIVVALIVSLVDLMAPLPASLPTRLRAGRRSETLVREIYKSTLAECVSTPSTMNLTGAGIPLILWRSNHACYRRALLRSSLAQEIPGRHTRPVVTLFGNSYRKTGGR